MRRDITQVIARTSSFDQLSSKWLQLPNRSTNETYKQHLMYFHRIVNIIHYLRTILNTLTLSTHTAFSPSHNALLLYMRTTRLSSQVDLLSSHGIRYQSVICSSTSSDDFKAHDENYLDEHDMQLAIDCETRLPVPWIEHKNYVCYFTIIFRFRKVTMIRKAQFLTYHNT